MMGNDPTWGAYLRFVVSLLVIVGVIGGLGWSMDRDVVAGHAGHDGTTVPGDMRDPTGSQPAPGQPHRALDLGWEAECAWQGATWADPVEPASLTELYLDLDDDDLEELYARSRASNERLPGSFRLTRDGPSTRLPDKSIRFRGRSARALPKRSFNIRLHEPLAALGTDRLNLNALYTDPAMVREHLSMQTFRQVGIVAPRTAYVDLYLNGIYEGLYLYVQRIDGQVLADRGLGAVGATLVRDRSRDRARDHEGAPTSIFDPESTTPAEPDALGEVLDARGEPDLDALAELVAWVRAAEPGTAFANQLPAWIDVEATIDFLALHSLLGDVDAYYDDYWLYRPAGESRFAFIPWDKDLTYGAHFSGADGGVANVRFSYERPVDRWVTRRNRLVDLIMTTPELRAQHDQRVIELLEEFDLSYYCTQLVDLIPKIGPSAQSVAGPEAFVRHPSNHVGVPGDHDLHVASVLDFVQRRAAFLEHQIADEDGPVFRASRHVGPDDVGTSVLFTGSRGWTIARLDVLEVDGPGEIEIEVNPTEDEPDVDRRWSVRTTDGARVRGQLSLYYRNTPDTEDWLRGEGQTGADVTGGPELHAVDAQRELAIVEVTAPGERPITSVANPFANRIAADVTIDGAHVFAVRRDGASRAENGLEAHDLDGGIAGGGS